MMPLRINTSRTPLDDAATGCGSEIATPSLRDSHPKRSTARPSGGAAARLGGTSSSGQGISCPAAADDDEEPTTPRAGIMTGPPPTPRAPVKAPHPTLPLPPPPQPLDCVPWHRAPKRRLFPADMAAAQARAQAVGGPDELQHAAAGCALLAPAADDEVSPERQAGAAAAGLKLRNPAREAGVRTRLTRPLACQLCCASAPDPPPPPPPLACRRPWLDSCSAGARRRSTVPRRCLPQVPPSVKRQHPAVASLCTRRPALTFCKLQALSSPMPGRSIPSPLPAVHVPAPPMPGRSAPSPPSVFPSRSPRTAPPLSLSLLLFTFSLSQSSLCKQHLETCRLLATNGDREMNTFPNLSHTSARLPPPPPLVLGGDSKPRRLCYVTSSSGPTPAPILPAPLLCPQLRTCPVCALPA